MDLLPVVEIEDAKGIYFRNIGYCTVYVFEVAGSWIHNEGWNN